MKRMLQPGGAALLLILLIGLSACGRDELSFAVTADDILGEYRVNQVAAEAKYLDTSGKVAGRVGSLEPRDQGRAILRLVGLGVTPEQVSCMFSGNKAMQALAGLRAGQEVTVIGKVMSYNAKYGLRLSNCAVDLEVKSGVGQATGAKPAQEEAPSLVPPVIGSAERAAISALVEIWSRAHNEKNMEAFQSLYAPRVEFYLQTYPRAHCVGVKQELLTVKHPDFYQESTEPSLSILANGQVRADFTKVVCQAGKSKSYQAYLILEKQAGRWQIVKERDLTTDGNRRKN